MLLDIRFALLALAALFSLPASSKPTLTLPLLRQPPPPARISTPFTYTLSPQTFTDPDASAPSITYTTGALPSWLTFTPSNLTFTGRPTSRDIGTCSIMVVGSSTAGSVTDTLTLTVTDRAGNLTVHYPIEAQLVSNDTAITSAFPFSPSSPFYPGVRVPPGWSFSLGFQPFTFTAASKVFYSARLADGSPLPPWLEFNNATVTFDGVTPYPSSDDGGAVPGTYQIVLAGSDIPGYMDVKETFNLTIAAHEITMLAPLTLNFTLGEYNTVPIDLAQSLAIDGQPAKPGEIKEVLLDLSDAGLAWASWSATNNSLMGLPPAAQTQQRVRMSVVDKYGDYVNSTMTVAFFPSAFAGHTDVSSPVMVHPGDFANVDLASVLASNAKLSALNMTATFQPSKASSWLSYQAGNNSLVGVVPGGDELDYDSVTVSLAAQDLTTNAFSHTQVVLSLLPANGTAMGHSHSHPHMGLSKGTIIALAVLGSLVGSILLFLLVLLLRRRLLAQSRDSQRHSRELSLGAGSDPEKYPYAYSASALETPAAEYTEKMPTPLSPSEGLEPAGVSRAEMDSLPQLSSGHMTSTMGSAKTAGTGGRKMLKNPFARLRAAKPRPEISAPIVMPSFENAAFQAQLAAAVDSAGIVKRGGGGGSYSPEDQGSQMTKIDSAGAGSVRSGRSGTVESEPTGSAEETGSSAFEMSRSGRGGSREGGSSRASWESEPPFVWSDGRDRAGDSVESGGAGLGISAGESEEDEEEEEEGTMESSALASTEVSSTPATDGGRAVQRSDFRPPIPQTPNNGNGGMITSASLPISPPHQTGDGTDEGISIDNIHFPTDSDIAHTETSSEHEAVVIATASRVDARRTLGSPSVGSASPASSCTERASPSPVMTTQSRLVSFGKQRMVLVSANDSGGRSVSQTAVVGGTMASVESRSRPPPPDSPLPRPPARRPRKAPSSSGSGSGSDVSSSRSGSGGRSPPVSLPSLPALPTASSNASRPAVSTQRILLGVSEPFHFYPPLRGSASANSLGSTQPSSAATADEYRAFVHRRDGSGGVEPLPEWLRFEGGELWGVPAEGDRGTWEVGVVDREGRVVGRFSLEVVGR